MTEVESAWAEVKWWQAEVSRMAAEVERLSRWKREAEDRLVAARRRHRRAFTDALGDGQP